MKKILIIVLLVSCFTITKAETDSTIKFDSEKNRIMLNIGYMYNKHSEIINVSFDNTIYTTNYEVEYSFPVLPTNFVKRNSTDTWRYSYSGPITLGLFFIKAGIEKLFYSNNEETLKPNPDIIDFIMFAPNSSIKYKLHPKYSIGLKTTTDYLLNKKDNFDRGILITPALEFSYHTGGNNLDYSVFTLSITNSSFINFDGDNQNDGVGIKFSFYVNGLYN